MGSFPVLAMQTFSGFGYFAGGYSTAGLGTVDKLNYATEARSAGTSLTVYRFAGGGFNSGTYGYVCGGDSNLSGYKTQFSTDTVSVSVTAPRNGYHSDAGNSAAKGYMFGGNTGSPSYTSVNKICAQPFASDTMADIVATLSDVSEYTRCACSATTIYVTGVYDGTGYSSTDKFVTSSETRTRLTTNFTANVKYAAACNSPLSSYIVAGVVAGTQISKMPFATETGAADGRTLTVALSTSATAISSQTAGYAAGNYGVSAAIVKIPFTTAAVTTMGATLSTDRDEMAGFQWGAL